MSRAFVKEPDGDDIADETPERTHGPHPNYITSPGLARLRQSLERLKTERAALLAAGGGMAAPGALDRDIRYLEARIERAIVVDAASGSQPRVAFGTTVTVRDENGRVLRFEIVGEDETDVEAGRVSWISPLARALEGAGVGETVVWQRPAGACEIEILSIEGPSAS